MSERTVEELRRAGHAAFMAVLDDEENRWDDSAYRQEKAREAELRAVYDLGKADGVAMYTAEHDLHDKTLEMVCEAAGGAQTLCDALTWMARTEKHLDEVRGELASLRSQLAAAEQRLAERWIPVEERLPDIGQTVAVSVGGIVQHVAWMYAGDDEWRTWDDEHSAGPGVFTHWCPMPKPPALNPQPGAKVEPHCPQCGLRGI